MAGTHKGKITPIGGQDPVNLQTLRDSNDGCVDEADPRVFVSAEKLQGPL